MGKPFTPQELDHLAHKRAARKMGWYIHAFVYVCVNIGLALLSTFSGRHWAIFPALGWGLGLLVHGLVVFVAPPGSSFHQRLVQQERARLQQEQNRQ
jgi:hypothetical protein